MFKKTHIVPARGFTSLGHVNSLSQLQMCGQIIGFFPHLEFLSSQQPIHKAFEKLVTGKFVQKLLGQRERQMI